MTTTNELAARLERLEIRFAREAMPCGWVKSS